MVWGQIEGEAGTVLDDPVHEQRRSMIDRPQAFQVRKDVRVGEGTIDVLDQLVGNAQAGQEFCR